MESSEILSPELLAKFQDYDGIENQLIEARQQRLAQILDPQKPLTTKDRKVEVSLMFVSQSDTISLPKIQ